MTVRFAEEAAVATWPTLRTRYSEARIRAQLDAGRWRRWGRAIVLHNGPLSRRERLFVARAHGSPGALVASFSALELVGLRGWDRVDAHVLTRRGSRCSSVAPVTTTFLETRNWQAVRRCARSRTQVPRQAVVVAAGSLASPRAACGLLAAAVQQHIVAPGSVRGVLATSPRARHRAAMLLALGDIEQGADALSEIDFVRLCRRHGLPAPVQQAVRREPSGRRRYLDATWRRADGRLIVVEIDGALHLSQARWWDDQLRQNELALADALVLRFPSAVVRTDPESVVRQLGRALGHPVRPA
ncbi:hypothetical protein SAMN05443575_2358 [Jatrophihabitans endophyticus]|uniref:DUF559 domain-containing protein n=1 Tax=Jatrophihabitans endophyticus TaxID=1206085 RepID=A0A1M5L5I9_9ACTN|nr:hypothetical protein [Jatrophihabitans endophyticus]SHG60261.1 hypothetical protein SAMN05443575_2358 [Jatrophihabitans endophyticus]